MMGTARNIFVWASELYNHLFADWLYIHYLVRTLILLLVLWMLVYACAQVFQYLLAPLAVLFFYHVLFRAWNYLVIETLCEWIYIHYYADDKPFLNRTYLRLCDIIKHNRLVLEHTRYSGILYRGRVQRMTARLMVITLVIVSLWTVSFGLFNEYAGNPLTETASGASQAPGDTALPLDEPDENTASPAPTAVSGTVTTENGNAAVPEPVLDPDAWPADASVTFTLNRYGLTGSNVRNLPGGKNSVPVEVVRGDVVLEYLGEYVPDTADPTLFWMKIRTPSGMEGYISSRLLIAAWEE